MTDAREPFEAAHFQCETLLKLPTQQEYLPRSPADQSRSQSPGLVVDSAPSPFPERVFKPPQSSPLGFLRFRTDRGRLPAVRIPSVPAALLMQISSPIPRRADIRRSFSVQELSIFLPLATHS